MTLRRGRCSRPFVAGGVEASNRLAEFDLLEWGARIVTGAALVPYVGWGVYTLRVRYRYHEDLPVAAQAATLLALALFYIVEFYLLGVAMRNMKVYYAFAVLGLAVSGAALYGPLLISMISRLLVDAIMPAELSSTREPHYSPAEALERDGDFEGALREYLVIARIFPKEASVYLRIGDLYTKLERPEHAVTWFERGLALLDSADKGLRIVNRLCAIYTRQLERPKDAQRLLASTSRSTPPPNTPTRCTSASNASRNPPDAPQPGGTSSFTPAPVPRASRH